MAGCGTVKELFFEELRERKAEGCNVCGFSERAEKCSDFGSDINALYDELMALEPTKDFPFYEPEDLGDIFAECDRAENPPEVQNISFDKFYGAWLGRCAGCALGKPFERDPFTGGRNGTPGWKLIYEWFRQAKAYPIKGYAPSESGAADTLGLALEPGSYESFRENIRYMQTDDDIRYTVLALLLTEKKGLNFSTWDVIDFWQKYLPVGMTFTAERQAYINIPFAVEKYGKSDSALQYIATYRNPFREWIGAQIRVDGYAYAAAGNPVAAARMAYTDAVFTHTKNGVYGAMFCAALISLAFVCGDVKELVEKALGFVPKRSRLYADISSAVQIAENCQSDIELAERIEKEFSDYPTIHTNNNAALCAAAIVFSRGNFEKGVTAAVLGGWDADCNGATVGSVLGAMNGAKAVPNYWKAPLNDTMYSAIPDFHPISISECAERSYAVWKNAK